MFEVFSELTKRSVDLRDLGLVALRMFRRSLHSWRTRCTGFIWGASFRHLRQSIRRYRTTTSSCSPSSTTSVGSRWCWGSANMVTVSVILPQQLSARNHGRSPSWTHIVLFWSGTVIFVVVVLVIHRAFISALSI